MLVRCALAHAFVYEGGTAPLVREYQPLEGIVEVWDLVKGGSVISTSYSRRGPARLGESKPSMEDLPSGLLGVG